MSTVNRNVQSLPREALAERIRQHDPENQCLALVAAYASLQTCTPLQRVRMVNKLGVHAQSKMRQGLFLSRLLLTPKSYEL